MPAGREAEGRAFYVGILGLEELEKPAPLAARGGCWFTGGADIHLGVEAAFRPARKAHPALLVDDLDAARAALEAGGHALTEDTALPGVRRGYVDDPFGNRIELVEAPEPGA